MAELGPGTQDSWAGAGPRIQATHSVVPSEGPGTSTKRSRVGAGTCLDPSSASIDWVFGSAQAAEPLTTTGPATKAADTSATRSSLLTPGD